KRAYCLKTQPATGETYPKSDLFNKANKNGNKLDLYGKMVGERILTDRENGEKGDNSQDTSYARVGVR
ncbi:hypothetical protein ACV16O_23435, partial [Escherichia coli]